MNYRKSLLSIGAAAALASTALNAAYLPLTTDSYDGKWVLFGVNAYASTADQASNAGEFSISDTYELQDPTVDEVAVDGLQDDGSSGDLGTLKAISNATVTVRVNTSGIVWDETEPTRTIYVKDPDGTMLFSFTYKASLEGKKLEYTTNKSTNAYYVTINTENTYNNPAEGVITPATSGGGNGITLNSLIGTTNNLVDYNLSNNPASVANYDIDVYRDAPDSNDSLRVYGYDAASGTWQLFDTRNSDGANDFLTLYPGKGYWGKLETDDENVDPTTSEKEAGLVLGTASSIDYTDAALSEGWNLISFDNTHTEIRRSTTGMLVAINATANGTIHLYDSTLNHDISVDINTTDTTDALRAKKINYAIEKAKVLGTLPRTFDLKAFPTGTVGTLALVSNKKFGIKDSGNNNVATATSLTGAHLWDIDGEAYQSATDEVNATTGGVTSNYGEYSMVVEPLTGTGTASGINAAYPAKVQVVANLENTSPDYNMVDIDTDLTTATASLQGATGISKAVEIDVNQDGTTDYALMAATQPFYVRDMTVTRVYKYASDANGTVEVSGLHDVSSFTVDINSDENATAAASDINTTGNGNEVMADDDGAGNVVVITTDTSADNTEGSPNMAVQFISGRDDGDNLEIPAAASSSDIAKGAIKGVWSPNAFVDTKITNTLDINVSTMIVNDQNVSFTYTTMFDHNITGAELVPANSLSTLVTLMNTQLSDLNISMTATANGTDLIELTGYDLVGIYADRNTTGSIDVNGTTDLGAANTAAAQADADLADDLKYNSVYTPNYVLDGPLYTMNDEGFKLKALVTGTTDITSATSAVSWESIDLTRPASEWLDSQDYNLFDTDELGGYWAYLSTADANSMAIANASFGSQTYVTYFDDTTATNYFTASIDVTLSGVDAAALADDSVRVVANVNGQQVELTKQSDSSYNGLINLLEVQTAPISGSTYDVQVEVADGLGNKLPFSSQATIDNVKPDAPTISLSGDDLNISDASADVAGFYVFNTVVPEYNAAASAILHPQFASVQSGICAQVSAVTISSTPGSLKVIAVDGTGDLGGGNASDISSVAYMPISKSRLVLSDTNNGASDVSTGGTKYDVNCSSTATYTTNVYGVSLTAETTSTIAKVAYTPIDNADLTGVPVSVFVKSGTAIAKIDYAEDYIGDGVFILIDGKTYGYTLPTRLAAEATDDTHAIDLTADGYVKTDVTF